MAVGLIWATAAPPSSAQSRDPAPKLPGNAIALEGQPAVRVETNGDAAIRQVLSGEQASSEALKITIADGRYYWASRGNRPLTVTASQGYTYLLSDEPGHYVRFRKINDRLSYLEHLETVSGSVTYWGELQIVIGK